MCAFYVPAENGTEFYMEVIAKIKEHDSKQDAGLQNESPSCSTRILGMGLDCWGLGNNHGTWAKHDEGRIATLSCSLTHTLILSIILLKTFLTTL